MYNFHKKESPLLGLQGSGGGLGFLTGGGGILGSSPGNPATSAYEILDEHPDAPDGVYWFRDPSGSNTLYSTYCIMQKYGGGWMKVCQYHNGTSINDQTGAVNANGDWVNAEISLHAGKMHNSDIARNKGTEYLFRVTGGGASGSDPLLNDGTGTGYFIGKHQNALPNLTDTVSEYNEQFMFALDTTGNGTFNESATYNRDTARGMCNMNSGVFKFNGDHNYHHTYDQTLAYGGGLSICWEFANDRASTNLHWLSGKSAQSAGGQHWGHNSSTAWSTFMRPHRPATSTATTPPTAASITKTGSINARRTYTTRGLLVAFDPGNITSGVSDGSVIGHSTDVSSGIDKYLPHCTGQNMYALAFNTSQNNSQGIIYRSANGGHFDMSVNRGYIALGNPSTNDPDRSHLHALNGARSMTLTTWFNGDASSRQVLMSRFGSSGYANQFNHIVDPSGHFHWNSSGVNLGAGDKYPGAWSANTWHLCHWVYDVDGENYSAGHAYWFIDGQQVDSHNIGTNNGGGISYSFPDPDVGNRYCVGTRADVYESFIGKIGQFRIHACPLSSTEILAEWNAEKARYGRS